jgi:UrcA family protein
MSSMQLVNRQDRLLSSWKNMAVALMMVAAVSGVVHADDGVLTERVRIDKFNLNTDAGSRALYQALSSASQRVCDVGESRQLSAIAHAQACYRRALENAVAAVQSERVTQLYRAKNPTG